MSVPLWPTVNACLNGASALLLLCGYSQIKKGNRTNHKKFMLAAMGSSFCFLVSYLIYHSRVGSVPYPYQDWTRTLYLAILIPHSILAGLMVPFIITAVYFAFKENFSAHTRITRILWPVWMFVSLTGIIVYLMLYLI